ncbi:heme-binding protein 1-like [Alosa pseudoharengus]|uniref:heme-binding protein 1-like n=1 Tax=Alosa pseudoharengus TaxID=34774 RepID=UPI003F8B230D
MDGEGCRLNGEGRVGGRDGGVEAGSQFHHSGLITLEDLESFTGDLDSDFSGSPAGDNGEVMDLEEPDQLLNYWQEIGRGHRVNIPQDMAEPIQQLTMEMDTSQERERVPFTVLKCLDKVQVDKRRYEKTVWACITMREETYEQSICAGFMKIMRFICQQNSAGTYLGMTIPIVTVVQTDTSRSALAPEVTVAYCFPEQYQDQPPMPFDPDITIETWPSAVVYTREFSGSTNEVSILEQIQILVAALDSADLNLSLGISFIVAGYTSLAATHRHNEIWFVDRGGA